MEEKPDKLHPRTGRVRQSGKMICVGIQRNGDVDKKSLFFEIQVKRKNKNKKD